MIDHYRYSVSWSEEDQIFIARVSEFSLLSAHGDTQEEAIKELRGLVKFVLEDLASSGEPVPQPISERNFSGKINLRMPQFLHRELTLEAKEQGVSLNQLINLKLSVSLHQMQR